MLKKVHKAAGGATEVTGSDLASLIKAAVAEALGPAQSEPAEPAKPATLSVADIKAVVLEAVKELRAPAESETTKIVERRPHITGGELVAHKVKGVKFARAVAALAAAKGFPMLAAKHARDVFGDDLVAKALEASTFTGGGALIPEDFSAEVVELLRERAIFRSLGANVVPMPVGSLTIPKQTSGGSADYIGEGNPIGTSKPDFGQIQLTWKKLAAMTPVSNDLLRFAGQVDTIVRNDLMNAMRLREDLAFLRDDGTNGTPKGIRHWAHPNHILDVTDVSNDAKPTVTEVENDLARLELALRDANVPMIRPVWILPPRVELYLRNLRISSTLDGDKAFPEMEQGRLRLFPYASTTQVPTNLLDITGSNAGTEIYLVDMDSVVIGEASQIEVAVSSEASFVENGETHSAFQQDLTLVRLIARHDLAVRYREAVAVLTKVKWGAAS